MLIPGPVEVPESVLRSSALVINHRSAEFRNIVEKSELLMNVFANSHASIFTTGSGTVAVESMVYSLTAPGEKVLAVTYGEFGDRLIGSLVRRGLHIQTIRKGITDITYPDEIRRTVLENRELKSVFMVHNETGNGTSLHNLKDLVQESRALGLRVFVDSVSGFGALPIDVGNWGIDAMATCSQKGLASVPGIGIVSLGKEVCENIQPRPDIPQYLDLGISLEFIHKHETPYTPSTGSFNALLTALQILKKEGIEKRWNRHRANAEFLRNMLQESGAFIMGNQDTYSDSVIAFKPHIGVKDTVSGLSSRGIQVAKGMGKLTDSILRIGNLGIVSGKQILTFLRSYFEVSGIEISLSEESLPRESFFEADELT